MVTLRITCGTGHNTLSSLQLVPVTRIDNKFSQVTKRVSGDIRETDMSHSVVDDSEVVFDHQEESAGFMEREGSLQNRSKKESWLAATEPYRGARPRIRDFDRPVEEELGATAGEVEDSGDLPTMVLEETVGRLQRDLEELQLENRFLKTPRTVRPVPLVRQAALTTTKVPWFDGSTSWEQYLQVFEAIVLSNGWGDATAALQLLSHLQGDALSVALLTPMPLQATRKELTEALSSHYGSPGRLANYRREFDKTVRKMEEDPSNFAIKLETLAVKAFGNMGQVARLRLIRDRFIAGHTSCDLRRYLDCVPPDTPLRDIVDRCRVWESHGTTEIRRVSKPVTDPVYPTYMVEQPDYDNEPVCMVSVNKPKNQTDQTEELLRKLVEALAPVEPIKPPAKASDSITLDKLSELLMSQVVGSKPELPTLIEPTGLEAMLRSYFTGQQSTGLGPRGRPLRKDWSDMKCFSCGKSGHSATRCPTLDVSFPFILPGWKAEKTQTGFLMISPKMAMDRRRAENED